MTLKAEQGPQRKRSKDLSQMWFDRSLQRLIQTEYVKNRELLRKMQSNQKAIIENSKIHEEEREVGDTQRTLEIIKTEVHKE